MRIFRKEITRIIPILLAIIAGAGIVYAAVSTSATGGGAVTQFTTNWGDCRNIQNNNGQAFFVPANTQGEWDAFLTNAPNKTLSSCCAANSGQACTSAANSCGQTNTGTYSCSGVCSASTPANPAGYGNACTSSANACGQTNSGTIQCDGSCSASTPANPANYGNACTSAANSCGMTNSGTIQCDGSCSATVPADSLCPTYSWHTVNSGTINGVSGCHFEEECTDEPGVYATNPYRFGQSCPVPGANATCYTTDSAAGCSGGRVQGFFRLWRSYTCSQD